MKYALLVILVISGVTYAEGYRKPKPSTEGNVEVRVESPVEVKVKTPIDVKVENPVEVNSPVEVNAPVTIKDEGTRVTTINRTSEQVPDSYVHYSPNYIQCMRTLGFQFANKSFSSFLGIPLKRDAACDSWLAAEEAQQNGHLLLQYGFMCQIRNIKKFWGKKRCDKLTALALDWLDSTLAPIEEESPAIQTQQMLIAAREVEELEEELVQTQNIITTQAKEIATLRKKIDTEGRIRKTVQESVKQIDETEQTRQRELDAFLEQLEQRVEKK